MFFLKSRLFARGLRSSPKPFLIAVLGVLAISACSNFDPLHITRPEPPIRQPTFEVLHRANQLQEQQQPEEALSLLNKFYPRVKRLPKDRAMIHQARAYLWIAQGDFGKATPYLEKSIEGEALGPTTTNALRFKLAQIYLHQRRIDEGIKTLEAWFATTENPKPTEHALAGQAYYLAGKYQPAIAHLGAAILSPHPKHSWYAILLSAYLKTNSIQEAKTIVGTLLRLFPKQRDYWLQLIAIETNLANEAHALASFELAQRVGVLTPKELLQIVKLNLKKNLPHRAAELLESGLRESTVPATRENWQLLTDAWILAREYEDALKSLKAVENLSTNTNERYLSRVQRGELLMRLQRWSEAKDLLQSLPQHSEAKHNSRAQLLLGISAYYSQNYELSLHSFSSAKKHASTVELATNWLERTQWKMGSNNPL